MVNCLFPRASWAWYKAKLSKPPQLKPYPNNLNQLTNINTELLFFDYILKPNDYINVRKIKEYRRTDFVYIDGNHDYEFVLKDLETWFTKVKPGGIIFGDDYLRPYGVSKAVNEFSFKYKLTPCFSDYGNQYFFIKEWIIEKV